MAKSERSTTSSMDPLAEASTVSVEKFTEAVFSGVLRAIAAQQVKLPGKIVYGIIYDLTAGGLNIMAADSARGTD